MLLSAELFSDTGDGAVINLYHTEPTVQDCIFSFSTNRLKLLRNCRAVLDVFRSGEDECNGNTHMRRTARQEQSKEKRLEKLEERLVCGMLIRRSNLHRQSCITELDWLLLPPPPHLLLLQLTQLLLLQLPYLLNPAPKLAGK